MNFSFNINSNISTNKLAHGGKDKLTPQEEYWLNRILRDHSKQIFVVVVLFLVFITVLVYYDAESSRVRGTTKNVIEMRNENGVMRIETN